jgi:NAD(P)-dependent dehydrogenase (short-subunit alcohol dehydrogenase family)
VSAEQRRVAVVTGGASGIGRAAALQLGADGFDVAVLDNACELAQETAAEVEATGAHAIAVELDVRSEDSVAAAFAQVAQSLGVVYALVNSAGVFSEIPFAELSLAEWRRIVDTNLTGTFLCCREGVRQIRAAGTEGRIVNVASVHSVAPSAGLSHYDASKGGIWMLTKSLALELGPLGISVNAVGPGIITRTRLTSGPSEGYLAKVIPALPLRRVGQPEDVAGPISFLCSQQAGYITGSLLIVDGGMLLTAQT